MFTADDISQSSSSIHIQDSMTVSRLLGEMKEKQVKSSYR
jgi:hypothetical protein